MSGHRNFTDLPAKMTPERRVHVKAEAERRTSAIGSAKETDKGMNMSTRLILSILGVFILIVAIGGITFAFFNYTRTGVANTIQVGRIYFTTS